MKKKNNKNLSKRERARRREQAAREVARREAIEAKAAFLRSADLQARWNVSRVSIWNWERSGLLPHSVSIGPNSKGWPISVIEAFERQRAAPPSAA